MRQTRDTDNADYGSDGRSRVAKTTVTEADRYSKSVAGIDGRPFHARRGG
jgi:hypothetical protein